MNQRLPPDAFALYFSLGPDRSYQKIAEAFAVTKRAVVKAAARENWVGRLKQIEDRSREKLDEKLSEGLGEMHERHRKMLRAMAARAARALQEFPLTSGMEGVRAAEAVIRMERILAGEASERDSILIEKATRQEIDQLLRVEPVPEPDPDADTEGDDDEW